MQIEFRNWKRHKILQNLNGHVVHSSAAHVDSQITYLIISFTLFFSFSTPRVSLISFNIFFISEKLSWFWACESRNSEIQKLGVYEYFRISYSNTEKYVSFNFYFNGISFIYQGNEIYSTQLLKFVSLLAYLNLLSFYPTF